MMVSSSWRSTTTLLATLSSFGFLVSSNSVAANYNVGDSIGTTAAATIVNKNDDDDNKLISFPLIPHHVQRTRRGLSLDKNNDENFDFLAPRRREKAEQVGALYHGYGTHYIDLWCGTPPQRQTVIVDTGSGVTAFPCSGCRDCGSPQYHIDQYFEVENSSTFGKVGCDQCSARATCSSQKECRLGMAYQEGSSWNAYEAKDICYVGGFHNVAITKDDGGTDDIDPGHASAFAFPLQFGCQTSITGLFKTQLADGIMGMENAPSSFWHQMYQSGKIAKRAFSMCFSRPEEAAREGTEAGAMTLGGTDQRLHETPMVYSTSSGGSRGGGFFSVHIRAVYLRHGDGGYSAASKKEDVKIINLNQSEGNLNSGGVIVDSGTTDTYWNSKISSALRAAFRELSGTAFGHDKVRLSPEELAGLPTIMFQISGDEEMNQKVVADNGGDPNKVPGLAGDMDPEHPYDVILAVPPSHYMDGENGVYVNRFYDTERSGSVLGANSMMGHEIMFDADGQRIGWAESSCDYTKLITENGYVDVFSAEIETSGAGDPDQEEEVEQEKQEFEEEKLDAESKVEPVQEDETEALDKKKDEEVDVETSEEEEESKEDPVSIHKKDEPGQAEDSHEHDKPSNDLQKAIADNCTGLVCGGGLVVTLLLCALLCFGCYRCCCTPKKKSKVPIYSEVELPNGSYKDEFEDEEDEDDAEYGETKSSFKDF